MDETSLGWAGLQTVTGTICAHTAGCLGQGEVPAVLGTLEGSGESPGPMGGKACDSQVLTLSPGSWTPASPHTYKPM